MDRTKSSVVRDQFVSPNTFFVLPLLLPAHLPFGQCGTAVPSCSEAVWTVHGTMTLTISAHSLKSHSTWCALPAPLCSCRFTGVATLRRCSPLICPFGHLLPPQTLTLFIRHFPLRETIQTPAFWLSVVLRELGVCARERSIPIGYVPATVPIREIDVDSGIL